MTRTTGGALALLLASTAAAQAGGLDRSYGPVGVLFEEGNYVELSYGSTMPSVSGAVADPLGGPAISSGEVGVDYSLVAFSFKYDVTDRVSVALVLDEPYGADIAYDEADPAYPAVGSTADFRSTGITVLGRYRFSPAFSVHAGVRRITIDADLVANALLAPGVVLSYDADYGMDSDTSYIVGAAFEKPEIALRVALTYTSETEYANGVTYNTGIGGTPGPETTGAVAYTMPQTLTLDFQTGVAPKTLLFGSVRWSDWSETLIDSPDYFANPVVDYADDVYTYTIGVGRQVTDRLSASASVIYETQAAREFDAADPTSGASNLAPYDGQLGLQLAAKYAMANGVEVSGGVRYTRLGDVTTRTIGAEFEDNHAVSLGLRLGYRF